MTQNFFFNVLYGETRETQETFHIFIQGQERTRLLREFGIKEKKNIKLLYKLPHSFKIFCYTFLGLEVEMARVSEIFFSKVDMKHGLKPARCFRGRMLVGRKVGSGSTFYVNISPGQARSFEVLCMWNFFLALSPQPEALIKQPACLVPPKCQVSSGISLILYSFPFFLLSFGELCFCLWDVKCKMDHVVISTAKNIFS